MPNECPTMIRGVLYPSQKAAAEAIGVTPNAVWKAVNNGTLETCGLYINNCKPVTIRGVKYASMTEAAEALGIRQTNVSRAVRRGNADTLGMGRNATTKRSVIVDGVEYESQYAAARAIGASLNGFSGTLVRNRQRGVYEFEYHGHTVKQEPRDD